MKTTQGFQQLKIDTAQIILALQDAELLERVRELLNQGPTPEGDLEAIDRGISAAREGKVIPLDEYLKELEAL